MFSLLESRIIPIGEETAYFGVSSGPVHELTLPDRSMTEQLDYAIDLTGLLDENDRFLAIEGQAQSMDLQWFSLWQNFLIFRISGGDSQTPGTLAFRIQTVAQRYFSLSVTQTLLQDSFSMPSATMVNIPNSLTFPNTQPLTDPYGAILVVT